MCKLLFLRKLSVILWAIVVVFLVSCDKEEPIPSYIYIPSFDVEAQAGFGTSTSKITEVWVYANDNLLGVFPIPAMVPILEEGDTELKLFPGIHDAGILGRPRAYPFYEPVVLNQHLTRGQKDTLALTTTYLSPQKIMLAMNVTFDLGNVMTDDIDDDSTTFLTLIPEGAEGAGGQMVVTDTSKSLIVGTNEFVDLPATGSAIYLEMEYYNDIPFSIWIGGHKNILEKAIKPLSSLNPKETWNKIYIPLTDLVLNTRWIDYQLIFNVDLPEGTKKGTVVVDNVKIVRYK